jgi:hypothetical protein
MHLALIGILSLVVAFLGVAVCPGIFDAQTQKIRIAYSSAATQLRRSMFPQTKSSFARKGWKWSLFRSVRGLGRWRS